MCTARALRRLFRQLQFRDEFEEYIAQNDLTKDGIITHNLVLLVGGDEQASARPSLNHTPHHLFMNEPRAHVWRTLRRA